MNKKAEWILRVAISSEFLGHGVFALQGKKQWIDWIIQLMAVDSQTATQFLFLIGLLDLLVALLVLIKPFRIVLVWAVFWGFWTAILRPIVGEPIWDFIERSANFGAPLALLFLIGLPKKLKDYFS